MKSPQHGVRTSDVEVLNVNNHGVWLYIKGVEYFMSHVEYPWFRDARVADILNVQLLHEDHLYWPALDVDLLVESLQNPDAYPLIHQ